MDERELQDLITKIDALKIGEISSEFAAGVDAANGVLAAVIQEQRDRQRIQQLEEELAELRMKYKTEQQSTPKRRGRKPKQTP